MCKLRIIKTKKESLMPLIGWVIAVIALGLIVGGILLLKQSATKFHLNKKQWEDVHKRSEILKKEED